MLAQQLVNGVVVGAVYSLFSLGFTLIFGMHRILNLAQGAATWRTMPGRSAAARIRPRAPRDPFR